MSRFTQAIADLRAEAQKLLDAANNLEALDAGGTQRRRGRKFMGEAERRDVSDRMKRYWSTRRKAVARVA